MVDSLHHALDVGVRSVEPEAEEIVPTMLEPDVLLLLLHLGVGPLNHRGVANLVLYRVHDSDRHLVNVAQIDRV